MQPGAAARFGVLVMAHGGSREWNDSVTAAVKPLEQKYPVEVAFGMADATSLQESVAKLEQRGVGQIAVVRLFVSGESWRERTAQMLGLMPGAPPRPEVQHGAHRHHGDGHEMAFWRVSSSARFAMAESGLIDAPEMGAVIAGRAAALSKNPAAEDVLILAHGPGDDDENARWLAKLDARAEEVRRIRPFRRVAVETLREDWPEKRAAAEARIRAFVERANQEGGKAIVVPFRVQGFGPYARVLGSLEYVSDGTGLLPDPKVTEWIEREAEALRNP